MVNPHHTSPNAPGKECSEAKYPIKTKLAHPYQQAADPCTELLPWQLLSTTTITTAKIRPSGLTSKEVPNMLSLTNDIVVDGIWLRYRDI